ncbi:lysM domain/BON superfamily protein [bacterium BMS3Bbin04]|nr:lysM domain/BON superfamily protein [bacterium BMS3Bbin04]
MTNRSMIMATVVLMIVAIAIPGLAQDRKMTYEDYELELMDWQQRENDAKAGLEDCEAAKLALRDDIEGLESNIAAAWGDIYDMLGITEADVDAFADQLDDFARRLGEFGRLTPEQMFERQDELNALETELEQLAMMPAAMLSQFATRIDRYERDIDNYRNRMAGPRSVKYNVMRGDHLWGISAKPSHFGDGSKWMRIYSVNREKISDPDLIYPDQILTVPLDIDNNTQYLVRRGDNLANIANTLYGNPFEWRKLYEANRELIPDPNLIYTNTILTVPSRGPGSGAGGGGR